MVLAVNDIGDVLKIGVEDISTKWRRLGMALKINYNHLDIIEADKRGSIREQMSGMLADWLRGNSMDSRKPSWKILAEALRSIDDNTLADRIAGQHECSCKTCTEGTHTFITEPLSKNISLQ